MLEPMALTGIGVVAPSGIGIEPLWQRWLNGQSTTTSFSIPQIRTRRISKYAHVSNEYQAIARDAVPHKLRRFGTPPAYWAVHAIGQAITHSRLDWESVAEERRGLFSGQGDYTFPNFECLQKAVAQAKDEQGQINLQLLTQEALYRRGADPFMSIKGLANIALALSSLTWRCRGVGAAFVQNEAAGIAALRQAMFELQQQRCDVALVVATGSYSEVLTLAELLKRGLLGEQAVSELRAFDQLAHGSILGEGAVALLLERRSSAEARNAVIHGFVHAPGTYAGTGNQIEKQSVATYGYRTALDQAVATGTQPVWQQEKMAIVADGRGVPGLDNNEVQNLIQLNLGGAPLSTPRPITGVIPAAGALLDLALASQILVHRSLPAVAGLSDPITGALNWVQHQPYAAAFDQVLCLQQSFSGFYSSVALSK